MVSVVAAGCALAGFAEGFVVAKDPTGPATGRNRVLKGGSYCFSEDHARIDARFLCEPIQYDCMAIGFRYVIPDGDRTR